MTLEFGVCVSLLLGGLLRGLLGGSRLRLGFSFGFLSSRFRFHRSGWCFGSLGSTGTRLFWFSSGSSLCRSSSRCWFGLNSRGWFQNIVVIILGGFGRFGGCGFFSFSGHDKGASRVEIQLEQDNSKKEGDCQQKVTKKGKGMMKPRELLSLRLRL